MHLVVESTLWTRMVVIWKLNSIFILLTIRYVSCVMKRNISYLLYCCTILFVFSCKGGPLKGVTEKAKTINEAEIQSMGQVSGDSISLRFRGSDESSSVLEISGWEFKNNNSKRMWGRMTENGQEEFIFSTIDSGGTFLLDIYRDTDGSIKICENKLRVYIATRSIKPLTGENLQCRSLEAPRNVYDKSIAIALVYDSNKTEDREIERRLSGARSEEKNNMEFIKNKMAGIEHYYVIAYSHVAQ